MTKKATSKSSRKLPTNVESEAVTIVSYYSAESDEFFVTLVPGLVPEDRKSMAAEQIFEAKYGPKSSSKKSGRKKSSAHVGDHVAFSSFSLKSDIGILKDSRSEGWFLQEEGKGLVFYAP